MRSSSSSLEEQLLRVLHVTPYTPEAWSYGGIPRVAGALTRGLARRGHEVTVCATDACDESSRLSPETVAALTGARGTSGVKGPRYNLFPNVSNTLAYRYQAFAPLGLSRFLRKNAHRFDIAHLHGCRNLPGAIAAYHLTRTGVPYVLAPNGTALVLERRRAAKHVFDAVAGTRMLRSAARLLAVSQAETRQLQTLGINPRSICLVPNPVDLDEFDPPVVRGTFRRRLGIASATSVVFFLGRITSRKRVDLLVRAFERLGRSNAQLVIGGNCPDWPRPSYDGLARSRCNFTGLLVGRERLEALVDADVLVYPTEHEIFGLVPLEALLCGTPVVVSDDSGCGEVIRSVGGGHVFAAGNADALAAAIDDVLDDAAAWRRAAADASARVRAVFGATRICEQLEAVYREVLR